MSHPMNGTRPARLVFAAAGAVLLTVVLTAPLQAAGAPRTESSLGLIPADAAYYNTMLRLREQIDGLLRSKAWAELTKLPAVQMGFTHAREQYDKADGKLHGLKQFLDQPENRELLALLTDGVSHEVFVYGGSSWADFGEVLVDLVGGVRYGPILLQATGQARGLNQSQLRLLCALRVLADDLAKIKVPDLIIGFKLSDTKKAQAQLDRLEKVLGPALAGVPALADRLKRVRVGTDRFLTLTLDGSQVPWEIIPAKTVEEKPDEFAPVLAKLKSLKLTVSLGVRGNYLLLALGSSPQHVDRLGKGARLADRPEFKRLAPFADKPLVGITYVSAEFATRIGTSGKDVDGMMEGIRAGINAADLPEAKRKAIAKDLDELGRDIKKHLSRPGASLAFSFLTGRGYEDYAFDFGSHPDVAATRPLTLLEHVGGNPILAVVGRSKNTAAYYQLFTKWVRKAYNHGEDILLEKLDKDVREKFEEVRKAFLPIIKGLDETTSKMLLPALADGQMGFVLDARWKSKQWLRAAPATEKALPLPEVAVILGVSDAGLLTKAAAKYRSLVNEAIGKVRDMAPPGAIPEFEVPPPQEKKVGSSTLYFYPLLGAWGVEEQVVPTAGLSKKVLVLTLSHAMAERCLERTPLQINSGPLADRTRRLAGAVYFNFPALVDALTPWAELALASAELPEDVPGLDRKALLPQVHTLLRVLKCFRGVTSATYLDGDVLVTHSETVLRDLSP